MKKTLFLLILFSVLQNYSNAQITAFPAENSSRNFGSQCVDLHFTNPEIIGHQNNVTIGYFESLIDAQNETNQLDRFYEPLSNPQIIYARVTSTINSDFAIANVGISWSTSFPPAGISPCEYELCDINNDGAEIVYLNNLKCAHNANTLDVPFCSSADSEIETTYYLSEADAINETNAINNNYSITGSTIIYTKLKNTTTNQSYIDGFVTINLITCTLDTDSDGIFDKAEDPNSNLIITDDDTDQDGLKNFEDNDDDGDGILTIDEDYNNNGDPTDDDTNSNGVPDYLEANVTGDTPTTYVYNVGVWSPVDPIGLSTSSDSIIVQTGDFTMFNNLNCDTFTVNPGAGVTISSGVTLTVASAVNLESNATTYSSLILDGVISGTINYNRYVSSIGINDLISAPVVGQTFGDFETANINLAAFGTLRAFAPYDTNTGAYQNYDISANATTLLHAAKGYRAATTNGSTLTFTGNVMSNDVLDIPIADVGSGFAWNLIGNPYPSYVDFAAFFATNSSEFNADGAYQALYGYNGNASNPWTVWNLATIADVSVTELLAPGQAFFVKAKSGGGLVDFTTSMRATGSSDDFILGRNVINNIALSQLNLNSAVNNSSTKIYFIEGTTRGLDIGYDAAAYQGSTSDFSIFSNLIEDYADLDMVIQSLPYEDFNNVIVPLGIYAQANETLTISMDDISSLPMDITIYLEDTVENNFTLLNTTDYTFVSSTTLNGVGRFYLRYASNALSIKDDELNTLNIFVSTISNEIGIHGFLTKKTEAKVYDIQGRLVLQSNLDISRNQNTINVSHLAKGLYLVQLISNNQKKTLKVVIK